MDKRVQGGLGDGSSGYQAIAEASAELSLKVKRFSNLFQGDQLGLDQQIAQSQSFFDGVLLLGLC